MHMRHELTPEEYEGWVDAYKSEPWGESRDDLRNMATFILKSWRPKYEGDKPPDSLPDLEWPYWKTDAQKVESEVEAYQRLKRQGIEAQKRLKEKRKKDGG